MGFNRAARILDRRLQLVGEFPFVNRSKRAAVYAVAVHRPRVHLTMSVVAPSAEEEVPAKDRVRRAARRQRSR